MDKRVNVVGNRSAVKYRKRELVYRVLWGWGKLLFWISPRPCFGFRRFLLRCFGAQVGSRVNIYPSVNVYFPWNLTIGEDSAVGEWALIYNLGKVEIGSRSTISQRTHLCAGSHDYSDPNMPLLKLPIVISDDVWVCADCFIGPNVTIAKRAIVAAASVVVKDVEESVIVAGNPAVLKKSRD
ncbi:MAG: putative colanic acid biosynthesis acetyltransferase [Verrucomicrobiota bacterium]